MVTRIELPVEPPLRHLLAPVEEACGIVASSDGRTWLELATHRVDAVALGEGAR